MAKPNLLILPGLLNDDRLWQRQVTDLKQAASCKVVGLGTSDTISAMAISSLRQAPPGPLAVAGLSMGGYVALEILRQAPERVVGLALFDTSARPDSDQATADRLRMMKMAETDFERVVKGLLPKMVLPENLNNPAIGGLFTAMAMSLGKEVYLRQQRAIIGRIDSRPHLAKIRCQTMVFCGRDDQLTPVALHEEIAAAIPGSRLVVAEKCAHLSPLEQPQMVSMNLVHWLSGLKG